MSYDQLLLKRIVEGALLAAGEALTVDRLLNLFEEGDRPEKKELVAALTALQAESEDRGFHLVEVASGWRYQVAHDLAYWVNRLWEEKPQKYSRALLETLSLIAYRQPITRSDIEEVRGVAVSSHIVKTLAEREWIKVVGHRDVPGRPALYATTRQFLDYFGLKSLDELPTLGELKDIDGLNASLELDEVGQEQEQIAEAQACDSEADVAALEAGSAGVDVDETPQIEEVSTPPLSLEEDMREVNATTQHPEADMVNSYDDDPKDQQSGGESEAASDIHIDPHPDIREVATPPLSAEEEVHAHNVEELDGQTELDTLADEVGSDAEETSDPEQAGESVDHALGSLFEEGDAADGLETNQSIDDEPDDEHKK